MEVKRAEVKRAEVKKTLMEAKRAEAKRAEEQMYKELAKLGFEDVRNNESADWDKRMYVELGESLGRVYLVTKNIGKDDYLMLPRIIEIITKVCDAYQMKIDVSVGNSIELIFLYDELNEFPSIYDEAREEASKLALVEAKIKNTLLKAYGSIASNELRKSNKIEYETKIYNNSYKSVKFNMNGNEILISYHDGRMSLCYNEWYYAIECFNIYHSRENEAFNVLLIASYIYDIVFDSNFKVVGFRNGEAKAAEMAREDKAAERAREAKEEAEKPLNKEDIIEKAYNELRNSLQFLEMNIDEIVQELLRLKVTEESFMDLFQQEIEKYDEYMNL